MKTRDFDKKFDNAEDVTEFLELAKARRVEQTQKRVFLSG